MSTCVITMHAKCNVLMSICNIIMMTAWHISYICFLFVCLFVYLGLSSHLRIFHSYGDVTIAGEGLQISTFARHSWPLSSGGSLTCHTYCDTGHPFIMVISREEISPKKYSTIPFGLNFVSGPRKAVGDMIWKF